MGLYPGQKTQPGARHLFQHLPENLVPSRNMWSNTLSRQSTNSRPNCIKLKVLIQNDGASPRDACRVVKITAGCAYIRPAAHLTPPTLRVTLLFSWRHFEIMKGSGTACHGQGKTSYCQPEICCYMIISNLLGPRSLVYHFFH